MKYRTTKNVGFSLVETVIALGIFAFCVTVLLALLVTGIRSARSVGDETNAVSIANSIIGAWQVQRAKSAPVQIPDIITSNLPALTQSTVRQEFYFDASGNEVDQIEAASLKLNYTVTPDLENNISLLELEFYWPPLAPPEAAQTRTFTQILALN
jgi:uncharacterized protein (TIGR02598 family)